MTAYLTIEFGAGTDISEAGEKALQIGKMLGVHIKFKFNSVDCTIYSNRDNIEEFVEMYHEKLYRTDSCDKWKWAHN